MASVKEGRWLLLIHQIPPEPAYLRVKVGRRLAKMGAVALKNSVYVLPRSDGSIEDFQWVRREIVAAGGDATLIEAQLVDGLLDTEVEDLFRNARDADYREIADRARDLAKHFRGKLGPDRRESLEAELARLERRVADVIAIDFFGASGQENVAAALDALRKRLAPSTPEPALTPPPESYRKRTWVTRAGIHVDRIASAWLIRRFIDPEATFKFVPPRGYDPEPGELRFDMFEAEFSHEGDLCTFEVLCEHLSIREPGLAAIAEIVHDIDLKDQKFDRAETAGVAAQIAGLALRHRDDTTRLEHGSELFEQLLLYFARKKAAERDTEGSSLPVIRP